MEFKPLLAASFLLSFKGKLGYGEDRAIEEGLKEESYGRVGG